MARWIIYLAKLFRLGLEEPGGEGAGVGPHLDGVVGVAQAPLDAVDHQVGVQLQGSDSTSLTNLISLENSL